MKNPFFIFTCFLFFIFTHTRLYAQKQKINLSKPELYAQKQQFKKAFESTVKIHKRYALKNPQDTNTAYVAAKVAYYAILTKEYEKATEYAKEAQSIYQNKGMVRHYMYGYIYTLLGAVELAKHEYKKTDSYLNEGISILESALQNQPEPNIKNADLYHSYSYALETQLRLQIERQELQKGTQTAKKLCEINEKFSKKRKLEKNKTSAQARYGTGLSLYGRVLHLRSEFDQADSVFYLARKNITRALSKKSDAYYTSMLYESDSYLAKGEHTKAYSRASEAMKIATHRFGKKSTQRISTQIQMAKVNYDRKRYNSVLSDFKKFAKYKPRKHQDPLQWSQAMLWIAMAEYQIKHSKSANIHFERAVKYAKEKYSSTSWEYTQILHQVFQYYLTIKDYSSAEQTLKEILANTDGYMGKNYLSYALYEDELGKLYAEKLSLYKESLPLLQNAYKYKNTEIKHASESYISTATTLARLLQSTGKYPEALPVFEEIKNLRTDTERKKSLLYALATSDLAVLKADMGKYDEANQLITSLGDPESYKAGNNLTAYNKFLENIADMYRKTGKYKEAEAVLMKSFKTSKKSDAQIQGANSVVALADLYVSLGKYDEAEPLCDKAIELTAQRNGKNSIEYANVLNTKAKLLYFMGRYTEAAPISTEATKIIKEKVGEKQKIYLESLGIETDIYVAIGDYDKSEQQAKSMLLLNEQLGGKNTLEYAKTLVRLGKIAYLQGVDLLSSEAKNSKTEAQRTFETSETYYTQGINIMQSVVKDNKLEYSLALTDLANLYAVTLRDAKAEESYKKAIEIEKSQVGEKNPRYATALFNLAQFYTLRGRYTESGDLYKTVLDIRENYLPEGHPDYTDALMGYAGYTWRTNDIKNAEKSFISAISQYQKQIKIYFPSLTEIERIKYITKLKINFDEFTSFAFDQVDKNPNLLSYVYNHQLQTKALIFNTSTKIRRRIMNSGDSTLVIKYQQWLEKREELARILNMSKEKIQAEGINQQQLENQLDDLEKELSLISEEFARNYERKNYTWKDVQKQLDKSDAAVEIIRFKNSHGKYKDSVCYAYLIVDKKTKKNPQYVLNTEGRAMEKMHIVAYRRAAKNALDDPFSYSIFWEQVDKKIGNKMNLYVSSDGVYHQLNLNTLLQPDAKYVIESHNIRLVSNTKDLVEYKKIDKGRVANSAAFFGFPDYNANIIAKNDIKSDELKDYKLSELPGTKEEIGDISKVCATKNIIPKSYLGADASEEMIKKAAKNPAILHIATHGFFLAQSNKARELGINTEAASKHPLLRSGLMLAGANIAINNELDQESNNGILTAYEAMNLELNNTELVIMSACETGLGEVRNGEGVFGLQRSFMAAGAKATLMSLWKVNDAATKELMTLFYQYWINDSIEKHAAFRKAQLELKTKYPNPKYWGAFVMVGI
jgi:CHAT domain-containing protein